VNQVLTSGKVAIPQGSTATLLSANGMSLTAVCDPTKGESVELNGAVVLGADSSVGGHVGGLASSSQTLETLPVAGGTDRGSFNASNNTGSLDGTWLVSSVGTSFNCVAEASGLFSG
jgi:lipopolysaccharide export system protein LptA